MKKNVPEKKPAAPLEITDTPSGKKQTRKPKVMTEEDFLAKYSSIVEAKLDEKVRELEEAKEIILEREQSYKNLFSSLQDVIITVDTEHKIITANQPAMRDMFGYELEDIAGKSTRMLYADDQGHNLMSIKISVMGDPDVPVIADEILKTKSGNFFIGELSINKLKNNKGDFLGYIKTVKDITERKRMEMEVREYSEHLEEIVKQRTREANDAKIRADEANRAKSDFLASMSHELRTPLNSIIGFSEVLLDELLGKLNETQKENVGYILSSGRHLLSLINDILDLSKVEAGKMELELSEIVLKDILNATLTMQWERAMRHGIRLSMSMGPGTEIIISVDERKLKQILFNLLSNALKFTPDGGEVSVKTRRATDDASGDFIEISVTDTGIGIKPEDMNKLFREFSQLDSAYNRSYAGTGLGLALARKLVELHGGRIWAESEAGKGSKFTFSLPLTQNYISERQ